MKHPSLVVAAITLFGLVPATVEAREVGKIEVAQWVERSDAPKLKTECRDDKKIKVSETETIRLCERWRTQVEIVVKRRFLLVDARDKLAKTERDVFDRCLQIAAARTQSTAARGGLPQSSDARTAFMACANNNLLPDPQRFSFSVRDESDRRRFD
jgi:hypothetical protein